MARLKRIELKVLPQSSPNKPDSLDYKKFLLGFLENAGSQGLTVGQIRARLAQLKSLAASEQFWDIEVKEHETLIKLLEAERWAGVSENIVTFIDDLKDAPDAVGPTPISSLQPPTE